MPPSGVDPTHAPFPATLHSVLERLDSDDHSVRESALNHVATVYWRPVYGHLRLRWRRTPQDAEDLTQEFFARMTDGALIRAFDPSRARFRTYLRGCVDHLAANALRAERRQKRGGDLHPLPLDFEGAERDFARAGQVTEADADRWFHHEWVRGLFELAVASLQDSTTGTPKEVRFRIFEQYDLEHADHDSRPTYQTIADLFGIPVTQVTNHLAWARREFRRLLMEHLRALSGNDAEFREEARALLGGDPP
jgi:RNA polymerase sigma factor (sigma-70 family)